MQTKETLDKCEYVFHQTSDQNEFDHFFIIDVQINYDSTRKLRQNEIIQISYCILKNQDLILNKTHFVQPQQYHSIFQETSKNTGINQEDVSGAEQVQQVFKYLISDIQKIKSKQEKIIFIAQNASLLQKTLDDELYNKNLQAFENDFQIIFNDFYSLNDLLPPDLKDKKLEQIYAQTQCPPISLTKTLSEKTVEQISSIIIYLLNKNNKIIKKSSLFLDQTLNQSTSDFIISDQLGKEQEKEKVVETKKETKKQEGGFKQLLQQNSSLLEEERKLGQFQQNNPNRGKFQNRQNRDFQDNQNNQRRFDNRDQNQDTNRNQNRDQDRYQNRDQNKDQRGYQNRNQNNDTDRHQNREHDKNLDRYERRNQNQLRNYNEEQEDNRQQGDRQQKNNEEQQEKETQKKNRSSEDNKRDINRYNNRNNQEQNRNFGQRNNYENRRNNRDNQDHNRQSGNDQNNQRDNQNQQHDYNRQQQNRQFDNQQDDYQKLDQQPRFRLREEDQKNEKTQQSFKQELIQNRKKQDDLNENQFDQNRNYQQQNRQNSKRFNQDYQPKDDIEKLIYEYTDENNDLAQYGYGKKQYKDKYHKYERQQDKQDKNYKNEDLSFLDNQITQNIDFIYLFEVRISEEQPHHPIFVTVSIFDFKANDIYNNIFAHPIKTNEQSISIQDFQKINMNQSKYNENALPIQKFYEIFNDFVSQIMDPKDMIFLTMNSEYEIKNFLQCLKDHNLYTAELWEKFIYLPELFNKLREKEAKQRPNLKYISSVFRVTQNQEKPRSQEEYITQLKNILQVMIQNNCKFGSVMCKYPPVMPQERSIYVYKEKKRMSQPKDSNQEGEQDQQDQEKEQNKPKDNNQEQGEQDQQNQKNEEKKEEAKDENPVEEEKQQEKKNQEQDEDDENNW